MVFIGNGSLIGLAISKVDNPEVKKLGAITSGIGLALLLVAGFGLIAKLGYSYTSTWIVVKMIIWLLLGSLVAFINRKPEWAKPYEDHPLLGLIAVLMVYFFKS